MKVFILWHVNPDNDDEKMLGVYASRAEAQLKIDTKYRLLAGFCNFQNSFVVSEITVGEDHWNEGFLSDGKL